ncbi:TerD family protein [Vibrio harveyi]|uniref:TerD family protein n=1 Tax=Vibrio harveyi TaxID=669 RepID=UPI003CE7E02B
MLSLSKGQRLSLEKQDGSSLKNICIGLNWGAVEKKGWFGTSKKAVDLDASVGQYGPNGQEAAKPVYFGNKKMQGIHHSGDDLTGDMDGDDGLDNEVIQIDLSQIPAHVDKLGFVLNSYGNKYTFDQIPYASIRIYEGTPSRVDNVLAKFEVASEAEFAGKFAMVLGSVYRHEGAWKFKAIGEATGDRDLQSLISYAGKIA